jgi:hypothetical protein
MRLVVLVVLVTMAVGAAASGSGEVKRITLDVRDADLASVVREILGQAGKSYSISEDVRGTVTAYIDDRPFEEALRVILSPRGFVWRVVGSVYVVDKKPKAEPEGKEWGGTPPMPPKPEPVDEEKATVLEKLPLNFLDAYEVVAMLQGSGQQLGGVRVYGPAGTGSGPGGQWNPWGPGQQMYGGASGYGYGPGYPGGGYYGPNYYGGSQQNALPSVQAPGGYGSPYQFDVGPSTNPAQPLNPAPPTR